jgi:hypothetical protein
VFQQLRQQYLLQEVSRLLQEQKWQAPEQIRQPSSLRGLANLLQVPMTLRAPELPAHQRQQALHQLLEQLLF